MENLLFLCQANEPLHLKAEDEFYPALELLLKYPTLARRALDAERVPIYFPEENRIFQHGPLVHGWDLRLSREQLGQIQIDLEAAAAGQETQRRQLSEGLQKRPIDLETVVLGATLGAAIVLREGFGSRTLFDPETLIEVRGGDLASKPWDVCVVSSSGELRELAPLHVSSEQRQRLGQNFPGEIFFV